MGHMRGRKVHSLLAGVELVDQVHDAMNTTDPNVILVARNRSAERIYGYFRAGAPSDICLRVWDKSVGFDLPEARARRSLGLISMKERLRQVGGTLGMDSAVGRGTRVEARVQLQR